MINLIKYARLKLSHVFGNSTMKSMQIKCHYMKLNYNHSQEFCEQVEEIKNDTIRLSEIIKNKNLGLSKLSVNLLKYLENNYQKYLDMYDNSIKMAYELSESPEGSDYLKTELVRVNRQINNFTKDNNYYDDFKSLVEEIQSTADLILEADSIGDDEIKKSAMKDLAQLKSQLETLQNEIIEYYIPDQDVFDLLIIG
jgi:hypothetical protein